MRGHLKDFVWHSVCLIEDVKPEAPGGCDPIWSENWICMTPIAGFAMTDWSHAIPQRGVTECYNALKSARNVGITLLQVSWENPFTSILIEFSDHTA